MQFDGMSIEEAQAFAARWLPAWSGNRPELLVSFDRSEMLRALAAPSDQRPSPA
jgi:hypothetical protein